jgi:hypothetical protein
MLRGIADVHAVADILAGALANAMPEGAIRTAAMPDAGRVRRIQSVTLAGGQTA